MSSIFGQLVIGPPGSGKTTYCHAMGQFLKTLGRKVAIVNIDPANDALTYDAAIDVAQLITLDDAMTNLKLGPNGALMYCMEFLEKNMDWLFAQISSLKDHYFIFDCPGQVELYTHHNSVRNMVALLEEFGLRLCAVHLVDSHHCSDAGKFISTLLMSTAAMLQVALPQVNVLSKVDLLQQHVGHISFGAEFYTEVLDLQYLLQCLQDDPITGRFNKLNSALVSLVEDYSLVSFQPLNVKDQQTLLRVKNAVDKANGFCFGHSEQRNVQAMLACAEGAEFEADRRGDLGDVWSNSGFEDLSS